MSSPEWHRVVPTAHNITRTRRQVMSDRISGTGGDIIHGGTGDEVIRAEQSITFDWKPDPGNSYNGTEIQRTYETFEVIHSGGWSYEDTYEYDNPVPISGPSRASGSITIRDVASSENFTVLQNVDDFSINKVDFNFNPTNGGFGDWLQDPVVWDPATSVLHASTDY